MPRSPRTPEKQTKSETQADGIGQKMRKTIKQGGQAIEHLAQLQQLRDELELLTKYSTDTVYRLDYETMRYAYISPNVEKLLGYAPQELAEMSVRSLILETRLINDGITQVESYAGLELMRKHREVQKWQADYLMRTKDGRKVWVSDISYPWCDKKGKLLGSVGSLRDITERMYAEQQMKEAITELAPHDMLTGLATRGQCFQKLHDELKRGKRTRSEVAVLVLNIDGFRRVNEAYNQMFGDFVLQEMTRLMLSCLRETDLACRIGGDEFACVLADTSPEGAYWVAERIRTTVAQHHFRASTSAHPVECSVSIGIAHRAETDADHPASLFALAEQRMHAAKQKGKNRVVHAEIHDPQSRPSIVH